jgi:hypothetical protein
MLEFRIFGLSVVKYTEFDEIGVVVDSPTITVTFPDVSAV